MEVTEQDRAWVEAQLRGGVDPEVVARGLRARAQGLGEPVPNVLQRMMARLAVGETPYSAVKHLTGPTMIPQRYLGPPPFQQIKQAVEKQTPTLRAWMDGKDPAWAGAVFHGPLGVGKTSTAVELLKIVSKEKGWLCRYEKLWRILARMKAVNMREEGAPGEVEIVEEFCKPSLLVVDEAGVNPGTASDHRIIYEVLDARYERLKPTIITTNHDVDDDDRARAAAAGTLCGVDAFLACFGTRTADRFTGNVVRFEGTNLREGK